MVALAHNRAPSLVVAGIGLVVGDLVGLVGAATGFGAVIGVPVRANAASPGNLLEIRGEVQRLG